MMNKKAMDQWFIIIGAILALIMLLVMIFAFVIPAWKNSQQINNSGKCGVALKGECSADKMEGFTCLPDLSCPKETNLCCYSTT